MPTPSQVLVIFDCDGVLVDSERLAVEIDARAIGELGWPITVDEVIHRHVGISEADAVADIEAHIGHPVPLGWTDSWAAEYRRVFDESLEPVPGVVDAVDALTAAGYRTCVASSGSPEKMRHTLGRTGLWDRFAGRLFSALEVPNGKPAPDLFLYAARTMDIAPERCVVVEDSRHGIAAATAAGMQSVGFAGGITPPGHLVAADRVILDMTDLPPTVADLAGTA